VFHARRIRQSGLITLALAAFILPAPAHSCLTRPKSHFRAHAEVVNAAKQIFVAVVADSRPTDHVEYARKPVVYSLQVTRVLKGKVGDMVASPARGALKVGNTIELAGEGAPTEILDTTFSDHADPVFWKEAAGRLGIEGDCSVEPPSFIKGKKYLVFVGDPDDTKDAERIDSDADRWLTFVSKQLNSRN
jgi:hypothetical protein